MEELIKYMNKIFKKNQLSEAYEAYTDFDRYRCEPGVKMETYVLEFEKRYNKTKKFQMELPKSVLSFKLLDNANLDDSEIPLLLSKTSMKEAAVKLELENDVAEIFGNAVNLQCTDAGHYCIELQQCDVPVKEIFINSEEKGNLTSKYKIIEKLHKQFAHPSSDRLKSLLKDSGMYDIDYQKCIDELSQTCNICKLYKRSPPRPVVCLLSASEFNEAVAMDLKKWKDGIGGGFGIPKSFLADNGVLSDKPPALEGCTINKTFAQHLNDLHSGRRAFVAAESAERIRRALRHQIRATNELFHQGDKVYFKLDDSSKWRGPGRVIGQDDKIVFVRYGSVYVQVPTCCLLHVGNEFADNKNNEDTGDISLQPINTDEPVKSGNSSNQNMVDDDENDDKILTVENIAPEPAVENQPATDNIEHDNTVQLP
ncbi:hypothetical protein LOTGIDRAFT_162030 [Lottia gigantea]|uniref:Uncharacterized protein n=1 Tax=Lottia gigantea TaxID=225164 RepID=V4AHY1_LOTGI|nr:hypothetical protein LOTGIDRAFT_162030 [Lottia gigantea]ESO93006.1 hypothetical protein LOTGIDRAFT_162030 [Lottia gigantea]